MYAPPSSELELHLITPYQLAPGRYRIFNGAQSARSFPGGGQQGPFQSSITMSDEFASVWEQVR